MGGGWPRWTAAKRSIQQKLARSFSENRKTAGSYVRDGLCSQRRCRSRPWGSLGFPDLHFCVAHPCTRRQVEDSWREPQPYPLIELRNSALLRVLLSLSSSSSMVSTGESGFSTLRRIHTRLSSSLGSSNSSLRVPLLLMSMAGKTRLSTNLRSRWISMLPVPLNSSKITSSMRLPVSIRAVATMLSDPPSSILRAAPKKRLGRCKAFESTPPESTLPEGGTMVL